MHKVDIFCTRNDHLHALYAPTKKSYRLDEDIMSTFVSGKNRQLLLAKGVYDVIIQEVISYKTEKDIVFDLSLNS